MMTLKKLIYCTTALALMSQSACSSMPVGLELSSPIASAKIDALSRIAVVAAYQTELDVLLPLIEKPQVKRLNGVDFYTGKIEGQDVVVFMTAISLVNAAMNTQMLLDHYNVEAIVISGVAGGLSPKLSYADVTVAAQWGQYNEMLFMRQTSQGEYIPHAGLGKGFPPFEFMMPRGTVIPAKTDPHPKERKFWFDTDPKLMAIAKKAASSVTLKSCTEAGECLPRTPKIVFDGRGVTGSVFMDNAKFREYLYETFDAETVEMETSAIGHVAYANDIPYIAFRSLSDLAGGGNGENEYETFEVLASDNNVILLKAFLKAYK